MNEMLSTGMFLLLVCSVLTGLIVEAIKKLRNVDKPNVVAAIVSVIVGIAVSISWVLVTHTAFTTEVILFMIALVIFSWLCSMLGYDKVVQTLIQLFGGKAGNE